MSEPPETVSITKDDLNRAIFWMMEAQMGGNLTGAAFMIAAEDAKKMAANLWKPLQVVKAWNEAVAGNPRPLPSPKSPS